MYPIYNTICNFFIGSVFGGLLCSFLTSDINFNILFKWGLMILLIVILTHIIGNLHFSF
jgi:hypothetical protein